VLTVCALLFGLLAVSNFVKPFRLDPNVGFVFLGVKTHGIVNAILAPAFGLLLIIYAIGIWGMRRWVLPIAYFYALYVMVNLSLFSIRNAGSPQQPPPLFMAVYVVIAVGVSVGCALILHRRRDELTAGPQA
jgi:hypothetical protein